MTNRNHDLGTETERMVVRYLRRHWPDVDRRLREGRQDDQGDLDGIPHVTTQVKRSQQLRLPKWVEQTLRQRDAAGHPLCWLIHRRMYRAVGQWDAYMPVGQLTGGLHLTEAEAWTWVRMDVDLAVTVLQERIRKAA